MRFTTTAILIVLAAPAACGVPAAEGNSVRRGDRAFAQQDYKEALAEYRLAVRQGAADGATLARVAHTYAILGRVDDAGAYYQEAAARDSAFADEAVSDLMRMAREALARNDRFAMATAVETALRMRPGVGVGRMALPLARHYFKAGEYGRALPFYQKAMAEASDSTPDIVFEVGQAYEEIGDCTNALVFFERFRTMVRPWQRGEVDWYIGTCSFRMSTERFQQALKLTDPDEREAAMGEALALVERAIEVGEPRSIQAEAWFQRGEILAETGDCQGAMEAYAQVRYADVAGTGPLVDRAQKAFDEIRFGRGLEKLRGGRCR